MKKNAEQKIEVGNFGFMLLLGYVVLVWMCDVADLLAFLFDIQQKTIFSRVIVLALFCLLVYRSKWIISYQKIEFSFKLIIGIFIIAFVITSGIVYPDGSYDVKAYHLAAQSPGFTNYFTEHFGKGNYQIFGFSLADKSFYYFRMLFGYRIGTIYSGIVLIIIYLQVYMLLKEWRKAQNSDVNKNLILKILLEPEIFALVVVLIYDVYIVVNTYYIDLVAIPFGLEVLRLILKEQSQINKCEILYCAIVGGIMLALKLTNIVYLVPLFLIFIVKNREIINGKIWIEAIVLGIAPVSVYLMYNYSCTHNPVFPYYKNIFNSNYFGMGWYDERWGGETFFEKMLWILHATFFPESRLEERPINYKCYYIICIIIAICIVLGFLYNSFSKQKRIICPKELCIAFWGSAIMWGLTTGYSRYFIFGYICLGISAYYGLCYLECYGKTLLCIILLLFLYIAPIYEGAIYLNGGSVKGAKVNVSSWTSQAKNCFIDRDFTKEELDLDPDMFFLYDKLSVGWLHLMYPDVYTVNTSYFRYMDGECEEYINAQEKIDKFFEDGNVYDFRTRNLDDIEQYVNWLNENEIYMNSAKTLFGLDKMMVVDIDKSDKQNTYIEVDGQTIINVTEEKTFNFMCGRKKDGEEYCLEIEALCQNGERKMIFEKKMSGREIENVKLQLNNEKRSIEQLIVIAKKVDGEVLTKDENGAIIINLNNN